MKPNTNETIAARGLDVGTSRICLAVPDDNMFAYQTQLNAFVTIPYSKMTEASLVKASVPHTTRGAEIVIHGNESERFADLLNVETRRTMTQGVLNPSEAESTTMLRQILANLLGRPEGLTKLCFTVPAAPLGQEESLTYHEATLKQVLSEFGFEVKSINEGLAVIYSELESSNYTGIGISCGGGLCNVCMAYLSVPVLSFSVAKAGDYIDESASSVTGERANRIRMIKEEKFHLNGFFADKTFQVLGVYYDEMIQSLVQGMKLAFANAQSKPKVGKPIPLVLSGGTALPQGFRDRFEKILKASDFPIPLSEIRMAADPLHTSAHGALVAAMTDM